MNLFIKSAITIILALLGGEAYPWNIYNFTNQQLTAWNGTRFDCIHCYWGHIDPGKVGSCPGNDKGCGPKPSTITFANNWGANPPYMQCWRFPEQVTSHGWVEISDGTTGLNGVVYNDQGTVIWSGKIPQLSEAKDWLDCDL